ncbi:hypothetical protein FISHEDRAFT_44301 [Fistulina hepatica ATCC 64428]|uniref:Uncharacterized protein n=1 Tax=Fistulina hepatica ATCC 64428 TaxID=1128425 RepID=A0A0D7AC12_9AGAR|nr:hypothetical protein FISHEDRAFT_44301 [Fistulina hepatica ATCC 64428]
MASSLNRFRQIPTFGVDTIRRFSNNVSAMKKLAARDFEDMLQCCIPAFEGLLPDHEANERLVTLLYHTAEWHALAKLRMHTEQTLSSLERSTAEFGRLLRQFRDFTAEKYVTYETPRELEARQRHAAATAASSAQPRAPITRRRMVLNLNTYKFHALGDYAAQIRRFGTTDGYSTQIVSVYVLYLSRVNF